MTLNNLVWSVFFLCSSAFAVPTVSDDPLLDILKDKGVVESARTESGRKKSVHSSQEKQLPGHTASKEAEVSRSQNVAYSVSLSKKSVVKQELKSTALKKNPETGGLKKSSATHEKDQADMLNTLNVESVNLTLTETARHSEAEKNQQGEQAVHTDDEAMVRYVSAQNDPAAAVLSVAQQAASSEKKQGPKIDAVDAVFKALSLVGTPYRMGGESPEQGFDCSGFVNYVFLHVFGVKLPRTAADIALKGGGEKVDRKDLQVGDLVLFNTMRRRFSHIGIYIGKGMFIHAPRTGKTVRMDDMNKSYWMKRFNGARRFLSELGKSE